MTFDSVISRLRANQAISANRLVFLAALYITAVFNIPFISRFAEALQEQNVWNLWFMCSVPVLLVSLFTLLLSLVSNRYMLKPVLIAVLLLSCLVCYGELTYGVVFDYYMIQNVFETDMHEATSYLNWRFIGFFLLTGVLPALLVYYRPVNYQKPLAELLSRSKLMALATASVVLIAFGFYADYAAFGRNNRQLQKYIVPTQTLHSGTKYIKDRYFAGEKTFDILDQQPQLTAATPGKRKVIVMVVGETARAQNFSYYGYARQTNPYTSKLGLMPFEDVSSCGTATAVSVPCMFSVLTHASFDGQKARQQQNLLDLVKLAGVDVLWVDNNSGCKDVCNRVPSIQLDTDAKNDFCDGEYCLDEALLKPLSDKLANLSKPVTLIVLHMMGSHGPTYFRRYNQEHRLFTPDCPTRDIQNCSAEELVNTYDNTIAYTDFVLAGIINTLSALPKDIEPAMLYVSDHGESLGEGGLYLHGFPYMLAPKEQTTVPLLTWLPEAKDNDKEQACLNAQAKQGKFSHDNIFHSMLELTGVKTTAYQPKLDLFAPCLSNLKGKQLVIAKN